MTKPAMIEYEIRILGSDGCVSVIIEWVHLNLNAAITAAKRMAEAAAFEIWTGGACVYAGKNTRISKRPTLRRLDRFRNA